MKFYKNSFNSYLQLGIKDRNLTMIIFISVAINMNQNINQVTICQAYKIQSLNSEDSGCCGLLLYRYNFELTMKVFLDWDCIDDLLPSLFQHEVIAVSEKVIVRLEDLVKWTVPDFPGWANSLKAEPLKPSVLRELGTNGRREALHRYRESTLTSGLNFKDVQRERAQLGEYQQEHQCFNFF